MALVSHLDLMRLYDRAARRASLPITFTGGFHPGPRIIPASALPLGVTSSGEIVDFELTESMDLEVFEAKLAAQLPANMPIHRVEQISLSAPAATQLLEQAEYEITVGLVDEEEEASFNLQQWQTWIETVLDSQEIWIEQTTKSGKTRAVNLRDRLFHLELIPPDCSSLLTSHLLLRYVGSCRNDGTLLRPDALLRMLEQAANQKLHLFKTHRTRLILKAA